MVSYPFQDSLRTYLLRAVVCLISKCEMELFRKVQLIQGQNSFLGLCIPDGSATNLRMSGGTNSQSSYSNVTFES